MLLVENEHGRRSLWRALLDGDERFGEVSEARSGREALDLLTRDYSDIVITDVHMPRHGRLDIVTFLCRRHPRPVVVATSEYDDVAVQTRRPGAMAFWTRAESVHPDMSERLWNLWQQREADAGPDRPSTMTGSRDGSDPPQAGKIDGRRR